MNSGFESFVTRLRQPKVPIDPIYLHGALTAFACGVEPDMPRFWRDTAGLGSTPPSHSLVDHFYNLVEALEDELDHVEFCPLLEWRGEDAPERWIQGVLETIEGQPDVWQELLDEEEFDPRPYLEALRRLRDPNRSLPLGEPLGDGEALPPWGVVEPGQAGEVVQRLYLHLYDPEVLLEERRGTRPTGQLRALGDEALLDFMRDAEYRLSGAALREAIRRGAPLLELIREYLDDCGIWEALGEDEEGDEEEAKDLWLLIHYLFLLAGTPDEAAAETLFHTFQELFSSERLDPLGYDGLGDYWPALFRGRMPRLGPELWALVEDPGMPTPLQRQALDILLHNSEGDDLEEAIDRGALLLEQGRFDLASRHALAEELLDFPRRRHRRVLSGFFREYRQLHRDCFYDEETLECLLNDEAVLPKIADPMQFYSPEMVLARIAAARSAGLLEEERLGLDADEEWLEDELLEDEGWAEETDAFEDHAAFTPPYTRQSPKIGRNDPCPCGSGRKYKRCCMGKDEFP
jgi:hypothetical protein